jgi:hypothetical protein
MPGVIPHRTKERSLSLRVAMLGSRGLNDSINRRSNKRMHATAQRKALISVARGGA